MKRVFYQPSSGLVHRYGGAEDVRYPKFDKLLCPGGFGEWPSAAVPVLAVWSSRYVRSGFESAEMGYLAMSF